MYDAIVVGMGPAGSQAGEALARKGRRVLGLERARMPRHKPCGGCLSAKAVGLLGDTIEVLAEQVIHRVVLTYHGEADITFVSPEPVAYMVSRETFDQHLARKAEDADVEVHEGDPVSSIKPSDDGYEVRTASGAACRCRYLIGADGVNGVTARALGYAPRRTVAVTLEGEAAVSKNEAAALSGTIRLDFGAVPYGYGWVFPKRGHWSLGIGSVAALTEHPRRIYERFKEEAGIDLPEDRQQGYRIPVYAGGRGGRTKGRSLLIGDAAALVDPFLGEGIYYALVSGRMAAEAVDEALATDGDDLTAYVDRLSEGVLPELDAAGRLADFAYRFPRLGYALFQMEPGVGESFLGVVRGDTSYRAYWSAVRTHAERGVAAFFDLFKAGSGARGPAYEELATMYDGVDFLWKQTLASQGWKHFQELMRRHVPKGARVLDAGAGTGDTVRALLRVSDPREVVGVDISPAMLDRARRAVADPRVCFQVEDMTRLPFPDGSFDVVTSSWAIETLENPRKAVREFLRVINDDGYVIYSFTSLPRAGMERVYAFLLDKSIGRAFDWHFLSREEQPYHDCEHSSLATFGNGLISVVALRKCCSIGPEAVPCVLPDSWGIHRIFV